MPPITRTVRAIVGDDERLMAMGVGDCSRLAGPKCLGSNHHGANLAPAFFTLRRWRWCPDRDPRAFERELRGRKTHCRFSFATTMSIRLSAS
jgi:hypothetical protein